MAITKIHPIKSTLNKAIDYITDSQKTDEQVLVSTYDCFAKDAALIFSKTRESLNTRGDVLARHLIQSFFPGETTPEKAHEIGMELCKRILKNQYEFVLATHVDRGHIHNHIIFNNVNKTTGKCYRSNKRSYHQIRMASDTLCKKNGLLVIDEAYENYKKKYKTAGKSWYENEQARQGKSWKSKLQFDIDRLIIRSKDWEDFLEQMRKSGYEIKQNKYIAFRHKDKQRFTRSKTIGEDYTEERLKERLAESLQNPAPRVKRAVGKLIDIEHSKKAQKSPAYKRWAEKHNLKTMAETIVKMRNQGIQSTKQLEELIAKTADERQASLDKLKVVESTLKQFGEDMENAHTVRQFMSIYKHHKSHPKDTDFADEYRREIMLFQVAEKSLKGRYKKMPKTEYLLAEIEKLAVEQKSGMESYSCIDKRFQELTELMQTTKQNERNQTIEHS